MLVKKTVCLAGAVLATAQLAFADVDWTTSPVVIGEGTKADPVVVKGETAYAIGNLDITATGALKLTDTASITMTGSGTQKINGYLELNEGTRYDSTAQNYRTYDQVSIGYAEGDSGEVKWTHRRWKPEGAPCATHYEIPMRAITPAGAKNLLVPGRALDCTREAYGALRVMVNCNQMGEAAGLAAAKAIRRQIV